MNKCGNCLFRGTFHDMGASCNVCILHDGLVEAIAACENAQNCPYHLTVAEAIEYVKNREKRSGNNGD